MPSPDNIVSGVFVRLSSSQLQKLYGVLEVEGYDPNPEGMGAFLSDVAAGKLSENTDHTATHGDILGTLAKTHGPALAKAALEMLKRGGMR